jgi:hypothetical protein
MIIMLTRMRIQKCYYKKTNLRKLRHQRGLEGVAWIFVFSFTSSVSDVGNCNWRNSCNQETLPSRVLDAFMVKIIYVIRQFYSVDTWM